MRIVKPSDGTVAAERRLAARMLCLEHGEEAYGPDLVLRPAPREPCPTITVRPLTDKGLPVVVHYRPTVGVIFYTAGEAFAIRDFVGRISALLNSVSEDHLKGYRAVAASPSTVLRHKGRVNGGNLIVGPRKCFKKSVAEKSGLPGRILMWPPEGEDDPPPHYSIRAAFTWVFLPVTAALSLTGSEMLEPVVNALVASVFYDGAMLSRLSEDVDFFRLTLGDFVFPSLPAFLAPPAAPTHRELASIGATGLGRPSGALVVTRPSADCPAGSLVYVGSSLCLHSGMPRAHGQLPVAPWDPDSIIVRGPGQFQCCFCEAPVGGSVILVGEPLVPRPNHHRELIYSFLPTGTPLLQGGSAGKNLLLCLYCWNALEMPECLAVHMQARVAQTACPLTQAAVCAVCPGYEGLAPLLTAAIAPVEGVPQAFVAKTRDDGPGAGASLVLAGEKLGRYPALTTPGVAALGLPVVPGLRLAEPRGRR